MNTHSQDDSLVQYHIYDSLVMCSSLRIDVQKREGDDPNDSRARDSLAVFLSCKYTNLTPCITLATTITAKTGASMNMTWDPMRSSSEMTRGVCRDQYLSAKYARGGVAKVQVSPRHSSNDAGLYR